MTLPRLLALISALAIFALAGCGEKKITKAEIDRIHTGMKASEVKGILGEAQSSITSEVSSSPDRKETIRVYGEGDSSIVVRYDGNDQVVSVGGEASSHTSTEDEKTAAVAPETSPENQAGTAEPLQQLRQAADADDAEAQYQLALSYMQKTAGMSMGDAGNSEYAKDAAPWFRKAAEKGYAAAQFQIGNMYWRAWGGLPMDEKQAAIWFRKAAEQGNADGEWQVGELYEYGRGGLRQNLTQAAKWYQKAALLGQVNAESALSDFYAKGKGGLPKDRNKACELYKKAAAQGNYSARQELEKHPCP